VLGTSGDAPIDARGSISTEAFCGSCFTPAPELAPRSLMGIAVLAGTGHLVTAAVVQTTIEFLERRLETPA
jgi:hypothetical protein